MTLGHDALSSTTFSEEGAQYVQPTGIASEEAFGTPGVVLVLQPTGIASEEAFGTPQINQRIYPSGFDGEEFGTPNVGHRLFASSVASEEAFGTPNVGLRIHPTGIASEEAFGTPNIGAGGSGFGGIASEEAFGTPKVSHRLYATPANTGEEFGTPGVVLVLQPTGIASAEAFGTPTVGGSFPGEVSATADQRDTDRTFLVDVDVTAWHPTDDSLGLEVEWGLDEAGPFSVTTAQPYDRHHEVGPGPFTMDDVPSSSPGDTYRYVWNAYSDLEEGTFEVWLRITAGGFQFTIGPIEVSTERTEVDDPLARARRRRSEIARSATDHLGRGLILPFVRTTRDFNTADGPPLVAGCVKFVFATCAAVGDIPGDVVWRPDFGHKLWALKFRNNDPALRETAKSFAMEAIGWEPRAQIQRVTVNPRDPEGVTAPNEVEINVAYEVIPENVKGNRVVMPQFEESVSLG